MNPITEETDLKSSEQQTDTLAVLAEDLRAAREDLALSLSHVSRELKISTRMMHALDKGNFDDLPGEVYTIGFVRAYSNFMGLDGNAYAERFQKLSGFSAQNNDLRVAQFMNDAGIPGGLWAIVACFLAFAIWGGWYYWNSMHDALPPITPETTITPKKKPAPETQSVTGILPPEPKPSPDALAVAAPTRDTPQSDPVLATEGRMAPDADSAIATDAAANDARVSPALATAPEPVTAKQEPAVVFKARPGTSFWLEVTDTTLIESNTAHSLYSGFLYPDEPQTFDIKDGLAFSAADAINLIVVIEGEEFASLGDYGEILQNIPVTTDALRQYRTDTRVQP